MRPLLTTLLLTTLSLLPHWTHAASADDASAPRQTTPQVKATWLGGPTLLVEFNGFRFITDPMLGEGEQAFVMGDPNEDFDLATGPQIKHHRRLTPLPPVDLSDLQLILLSHAHEDHFDQEAQRRLSPALPLITPAHDLQNLYDKGFQQAQSLAWGESRSFAAGAGEITITAVPAHHSNQTDIAQLLGQGNGYWIEFKEQNWRKTLYWTGDTLPTPALLNALRPYGQPDVMIPHLGRVGTPGPLGQISMGASDVIKLADAVQPHKLLPIHHSSYALYLEPITTLVNQSVGQAFALDLISEGTTVAY
ncbi:MBL fold metallo-hydrolase [Balneatrix alpica]|uniref:MBL fold metallo-hydrolase n=1 Tax=Balneatrix alpica TaxID=75684 RepID=A0ABV5ZH89_9GAMM|nr:MBL fold metallo-hydrolase [Balneatrix alpica]